MSSCAKDVTTWKSNYLISTKPWVFSVAEKWGRARDKDQGKKERREGENKSHLPS